MKTLSSRTIKIVNRKVNTDTARNSDSRNCAKNAISLEKGKCESAILHSMINSTLLILLNARNRPIACWNNRTCILPIVSLTVPTEKFNTILESYAPKTIYMNNGEAITNYLKAHPEVNVRYNSLNLEHLLNDLKKEYENKKKEQVQLNGKYTISYSEAKQLDKSLTYKEYKKIFEIK